MGPALITADSTRRNPTPVGPHESNLCLELLKKQIFDRTYWLDYILVCAKLASIFEIASLSTCRFETLVSLDRFSNEANHHDFIYIKKNMRQFSDG